MPVDLVIDDRDSSTASSSLSPNKPVPAACSSSEELASSLADPEVASSDQRVFNSSCLSDRVCENSQVYKNNIIVKSCLFRIC